VFSQGSDYFSTWNGPANFRPRYRFPVFVLAIVANQHFWEFGNLLSPCRLCVGLRHSKKSDVSKEIDSNEVESTASRARRKRDLYANLLRSTRLKNTQLWHHLFTLTEAENFSLTSKVNKRFNLCLASKTSAYREACKGRTLDDTSASIIQTSGSDFKNRRWCIFHVEIFSAGFQDKFIFLPCLMARVNCYNCSWSGMAKSHEMVQPNSYNTRKIRGELYTTSAGERSPFYDSDSPSDTLSVNG